MNLTCPSHLPRPSVHTSRSALFRSVRLVVAIVVAIAAGLGLGAPAVQAHSPHDLVRVVRLSPTYSEDNTAFIVTNWAGWRFPTHLYRSTDGGVSWQSVSNGLDNRHYASDFQFSPNFTDDGVAFMATTGDGIFRSTDHGATWSAFNAGLGTLDITLTAISPAFATDGAALAAGASGGLYQSTDGGETWAAVLDEDTKIRSLEFSRLADDQVLALAGDATGRLYASADGGATWQVRLKLPKAGAITAIAASPNFASDATYFLGTLNKGLWRIVDDVPVGGEANQGLNKDQMTLYGSDDLGCCEGIKSKADALTELAQVLLPRIAGVPQIQPTEDIAIGDIAISPDFAEDGTLIVAAQKQHLFRSRDGGETWERIGSEEALTHKQADEYGRPDFYDVTLSPAFPADETLFLAGFKGLFKSEDAGSSWKEVETMSAGLPTGLDVSPDFANDQEVAVATYHAGSIVTHDGGESWQTWNQGLFDGRLYGILYSPESGRGRLLFHVLETWRAQGSGQDDLL